MKSDADLARKYMIPFVFAIGVSAFYILLLNTQSVALGVLTTLGAAVLGIVAFWIAKEIA